MFLEEGCRNVTSTISPTGVVGMGVVVVVVAAEEDDDDGGARIGTGGGSGLEARLDAELPPIPATLPPPGLGSLSCPGLCWF